MAKIYVFLANGFETVEALTVVDILRRAKQDVVMVSTEDTEMVRSAQEVYVKADVLLKDSDLRDADLLFVPGGLEGTRRLKGNDAVKFALLRQNEQKKYLSAICAGPSVLGQIGILDGKTATCYPGFEAACLGADITGEKVETDDNVITGKGLGAAIDLGLELVRIFVDEETSVEIGKSIQYLA